ncbi:predicted protein [Naegleria gruberi]|uniref:Predicted protein n=1 Tax=Naegleria gruberi TaxID=5762 RepID=D2VBI4_NAEGR|nr:uncharacterized protein NAEGRDRAFT_66228 [Naegleria gruberi]EFC45912.1 predicted protein [Naegleria gruberi]|eukprot:XP_002678656.1 predicted protein [Naegleria gruberi strain NEG-M]
MSLRTNAASSPLGEGIEVEQPNVTTHKESDIITDDSPTLPSKSSTTTTSPISNFLLEEHSFSETIKSNLITSCKIILLSILFLFVMISITREDRAQYAFSMMRKVLPSSMFAKHHDTTGEEIQRNELDRIDKARNYINNMPTELVSLLRKSFEQAKTPSSGPVEHSKFCISIPSITRNRQYQEVLIHSILANTSMNDLIPTSNIAINIFDASSFPTGHLNAIKEKQIFNIFHRDDIKGDRHFFTSNFDQVYSMSYHQKQALDYITAIEYCTKHYPHMDYIIILEDDAVVPKGWLDSIRELLKNMNHDFYDPSNRNEDRERLFKNRSFMWMKLYFSHSYNDYNEKRLHLISFVALFFSFIMTIGYFTIQANQFNSGNDKIILNRFKFYWIFVLLFAITLGFLLLVRFHYLESKFIKLTKFFSNEYEGTGRKYHLQRDFPHYGSAVAMLYPNKPELINPFLDYLREWQPQASSEYPNDRIIYNYVYKKRHKDLDSYLVIPDLVEHVGSVSSRLSSY